MHQGVAKLDICMGWIQQVTLTVAVHLDNPELLFWDIEFPCQVRVSLSDILAGDPELLIRAEVVSIYH